MEFLRETETVTTILCTNKKSGVDSVAAVSMPHNSLVHGLDG
jgi:hypothetical protein